MTLINNRLLHSIEGIVRSIEREYQRTQGLILTEDDLKCLIYKKLVFLFQNKYRPSSCFQHDDQVDYLPAWRSVTIDPGIFASPVHTEIPWYDQNNKLTIRPDITILEPKHLSILHGLKGPKLPSKQAAFGGQGIIFEIKFNRFKNGISPYFFKHIKDDFDKIQGLFEKLSNAGKERDLYCFFIVFNKTNLKCNDFQQFLNQNGTGLGYQLLYGTGLVGDYPSRCV